MAFSLIQQKPANGVGTNPTATFTSTPVAGHLLVAVVGTSEGVTGSITNASGYTTRADDFQNVSPVEGVRIAAKIAGASEPTTVTFTDAVSKVWSVELLEFSGNAASGSEFDAASAGASNGGSVTSQQPGSLTPAAVNELIIVACALGTANSGGAVDSSFNAVDAATLTHLVVGYKIKTDAAAENPTCSWTAGSTTVAIQAAFNPSLIYTPRIFGARQAVARAAYR